MSNINLTHIEREPHELDSADFGKSGTFVYRNFLVCSNGMYFTVAGKNAMSPERVDEIIDEMSEQKEKPYEPKTI